MRKRSKYIPKPIISPLDYLTPASKTKAGRHMLPIYTALDLIAVGDDPGPDEWRHLSDCVNITEQLYIAKHLPADTEAIVLAAIGALVRASQRYKSGRGMRLDGEGIVAIRACVYVYDQALTMLPQSIVYKAQCEVIKQTAAVLAGRSSGHTVVKV